MRRLVESRNLVSVVVSTAVGLYLFRNWAFPAENDLLQMVLLQKPYLFYGIKYGFVAMLFSTPYIAFSILFSFTYIFVVRREEQIGATRLAPYLSPERRHELYLVIGELHHPKRPQPAATPRWLIVPERGLFTGIAVFGAVGSGKTTGCMFPFAEQILAYCADEAERRVSGLVLEVKGDFCHKVRGILEKYCRADDYVEISLASPYRYNPLHNELEAYALAYGIASLLNNLFGRGKEPFWQQAYTNLVKFIILLHKVLYDYVTLFDVYECAINPHKLEAKIAEGEGLFSTADYISIDDSVYVAHRELSRFPWERIEGTNWMKAPATDELRRILDAKRIPCEIQTESGPRFPSRDESYEERRQRFEAVKRWFNDDWRRIEPKLRTSIVEGISVFLSLFDDNPAVKRTFCPPKECYDPVRNRDGRYGTPLPPFSSLIEQGKVCALNFPIGANPGLARAVGTMLKQDFQRTMIGRIPKIESDPEKHWRSVLPLSTASYINQLIALRSLFNELAWSEELAELVRLIRREDFPRPPQRLPRPLTLQQDQLLQQEFRRRNDLGGNVFLLLRYTGMRIGECADLSCDCLHSTGSEQWAIHVPLGKLKTERMVPVDFFACELVQRLAFFRSLDPLPADGRLLARASSKEALVRQLRDYLHQVCHTLGLPTRIVPHQLRHTYATEMLRAGVSFPVLMKLLGHTSPDMTMRYVDVALTDLQREYQLARSRPRHLVPQPKVPSTRIRAGLQGVIDSLLAAQHVLEMFRRVLPHGDSRACLDRLSNRLTKIVSETRKLRTPEK